MSGWNPTFYGRSIPAACHAELERLQQEGHRILCVAFPFAGGDRWSVITDQTFVNRGVPQACRDRMLAMHQAGHRLRCVAFPPQTGNRWCIVTDRDVASQGIVASCRDRLRTLRDAGHDIRWVAFAGPGNAWSIVTDRDVSSQGISAECDRTMREFRDAGNPVTSVAFPLNALVPIAGNRYTIATASGAFFNRNTPPGCHRVMRAMSRIGVGRVAAVAFHPGGGYVVYSDASPAGAEHAVLRDGTEQFSLSRFAANLREQLDGKVVKYGFVVRLGAAVRAHAAGPARVAGDEPARPFSVFDWFNPASVTKPITAVALVRALNARGLGTDTRIWRWLPSDWTIPASVRTITVEELLNHRSGFRSGDYTYAKLRGLVEAGITLANKVYKYENTNYALARILVATLSGLAPRTGSGAVLAAATSVGFRSYCQQHLFDRMGVPSVAWKADADAPTLFYPRPALPFSGTTYGDWTHRAGSSGVHLSLAEFAAFAGRLSGSEDFLPAAARTVLEEQQLGWFQGGQGRSRHHGHGGFFPGSRNGGAQLHSTIFAFANGVHGAAVFNGLNDEVGFDYHAAYEAAWQVPSRRAVRTPRLTRARLAERVEAMRRVPGWSTEG